MLSEVRQKCIRDDFLHTSELCFQSWKAWMVNSSSNFDKTFVNSVLIEVTFTQSVHRHHVTWFQSHSFLCTPLFALYESVNECIVHDDVYMRYYIEISPFPKNLSVVNEREKSFAAIIGHCPLVVQEQPLGVIFSVRDKA